MRSFQDKATFIVPLRVNQDDTDGAVPVQGAVAAATIAAMARDAQMRAVTLDGSRDGQPVSLVVVYSDRLGRTDFAYFVTNAVRQVGITLELPEVLVEVNGNLGIYTRGEDYL